METSLPMRSLPKIQFWSTRAISEYHLLSLPVAIFPATHDQVEAMTLGQRVSVLKDGVLQQVDTPQNLYNHPANLFVAAFIGSPPMNLVEAEVTDTTLTFGGVSLPRSDADGLDDHVGRRVILGIRPSDLEDCDVWHNEDLPTLEARAEVTEELGSEVNIIFPVDAPPVLTEDVIAAASDDADHDNVPLIADEQLLARFCARVDARTRCKPGDTVRLSVDPARFHYFDPETGLAIGARSEAPVGA